MFKALFDNYDCFYNAVFATTALTNSITAIAKEDVKRVNAFVCDSYGMSSEFSELSEKAILEKLAPLGLTAEYSALCSRQHLGSNAAEDDLLVFVKGAALNELAAIGGVHALINKDWFDYSYRRAYQPAMRYADISKTASFGIVSAVRESGIMRALGIGCKQDLGAAEIHFLQGALWGDIPSVFMLAHAYDLAGDEANAKLWREVSTLANELLCQGLTVVPDVLKDSVSKNAAEWYAVLSSIKMDVVNTYDLQRINFSFIEAIASPSVSYKERMSEIDSYNNGNWRGFTNSPRAFRNVGFRDNKD